LNAVFLRPDILNNLTDLLTESTVHAINDEKVQKNAQEFAINVIKNKSIKEGILENYVYSPVRSFFSFGFQ
jgi:hypothetical protein